MKDNGDGSYTVPVTWVSGTPGAPGVIVSQPDRPPVLVPGAPLSPGGCDSCGSCCERALGSLLRTLCRCLAHPPHHPREPCDHDPHTPHAPHRPRPREGGGGKGCCGDQR